MNDWFYEASRRLSDAAAIQSCSMEANSAPAPSADFEEFQQLDDFDMMMAIENLFGGDNDPTMIQQHHHQPLPADQCSSWPSSSSTSSSPLPSISGGFVVVGGSPEISTFPFDIMAAASPPLPDMSMVQLIAVQHPPEPPKQPVGAFKPYRAALLPRRPTTAMANRQSGQRMMKMVISLSRSLEAMRREAQAAAAMAAAAAEEDDDQEQRPNTNQVHHMISERKRREKLNESFHAIRSLLPPGTKKDKASVLASTTDYLSVLKARVSELEEKNRELERRLNLSSNGGDTVADDVEGVDGGEAAVEVKVTKSMTKAVSDVGDAAELEIIELSVTAKMVVSSAAANLVHSVTGCLKKMAGVVGLPSMEAATFSSSQSQEVFFRLTFTLHVQEKEWDEVTLREAVKKAATNTLADLPLLPAAAAQNCPAHQP